MKAPPITAIILTALITAVAPAAAQTGRVAGRVLDQTGGVLRDVTIDLVVQGTELTATTDGDGRYEFDNVPPGSAELTYRLLNFGVLLLADSSSPSVSFLCVALLVWLVGWIVGAGAVIQARRVRTLKPPEHDG